MEKNVYQIIQDWHELLKSGTITETEFAAKKSELLGTGQKKKIINQGEELIRVLTPEEQAQSDAEYDLLFNNKTWFQKNKNWIIGLSVAALTGFIIWYLINNESNSSNNLNNQSAETINSPTNMPGEAVGEPIENVGNSILFTTFDGMSEDGSRNNELVAVPIAVYINGKYETPPTCEIGSNEQKAIDECEKAKEILLPSVRSGERLYILDNGQQLNSIKVLSIKQFGYSVWQTYSALIQERPKSSILTDNTKLGTNKLYAIKDRPILSKRKDPEGNILTDKLLTKVDIDGDGMPELIYECSDYEGTFYQIYSNKNHNWTKVYEGGYQGL